MTERIVTQGEDINAQLTIYNPSGIVLNMGGASVICVALLDGYDTIKAVFRATSPGVGEYSIDTTSATSGILNFKVLTEITKLLPEGKYYWEVAIEYPDGAYTDDSKYSAAVSKRYAFTIKKSALRKGSLI